jgi:hypothetical protein
MYPSITESLTNFVTFLEDTSDSYKEFIQTVNNNIEENVDTLNVNS